MAEGIVSAKAPRQEWLRGQYVGVEWGRDRMRRGDVREAWWGPEHIGFLS